jgi:copper resistance protein C
MVHPSRPRLRHRASAALLALGATAALTTVAVLPAAAHNFVVSTTPGDGTTLTTPPERFEILTNEALLDVAGNATGFALQVTDEQGLFYGDGCLVVDGVGMSMGAWLGEEGAYTVSYQFISADGHTLSGTYEFFYEPSPAAEVTPGSETPLACGDPVPGAAADATTEPEDVEPGETAEPAPQPDATEPTVSDASSGIPTALAVGIGLAVIALLAAIIGGVAYSRRSRSEDR